MPNQIDCFDGVFQQNLRRSFFVEIETFYVAITIICYNPRMSNTHTSWLLLIVSLPSDRGTARMRIWRALKALGCVALRDGAYLVPDEPALQKQLADLNAESVREGGSGWLLTVMPSTESENDAYQALFDRSADYLEWQARLDAGRDAIASANPQEANRLVRKLRKEYEAIRATDFFPNKASAEAAKAWTSFVAMGEPQPQAGAVARLDVKDYQGRRWATRKRPWVDRVASAWLIRRFIDPAAIFLWIESPAACPADALGFDFDGAAFTHVGELVTFEVLAASFGLAQDPGVARLGKLVHALDVGGSFVPEASGFEAMLDGARQRIGDDDALLANISAVLDSLHAHFSKQEDDNVER
jgi:hypothetical protein